MKRIEWQTRVLEQATRMHRIAAELSYIEEEQLELRDKAEIVRKELHDLEIKHLGDTKEPWDD